MINFININDMSVVRTGKQKKKVLFKIKGDKVQNKNEIRMPLNISLSIDVSGSMNDSIGGAQADQSGQGYFNNAAQFLNGLRREVPVFGNFKTKITQVKDAAIKCVDLLEDGDFISIVTFANTARVIQEAIQINSKNREQIKSKIKSINANGGTNLHEGWLQSGMEVAKNLSAKNINRILVLTDGETNQGIVDSKEISASVEGLAKRGISTSTFGVGDHYNEDLLEKMATVSGGNSYYIEDESKVQSILMEEFNCLNNIVADNATLEFNPINTEFTVTCLNELDYVNKKYMIGNLIGGREVTALFEYEFNNTVNVGEKFNLGEMKLSFTNKSGKQESNVIELSFVVVTEETFSQEKISEEVNIQSTILDIAKQQKLAKEEMKLGNRDTAYDILNKSIAGAQLYSADARVMGEINQLNTFMADSQNYSDVKMSKMLSSMSYSTRNSKK